MTKISQVCGRYTLRTPLGVLAKQFEFDLDAAMGDAPPRYNIAPTLAVFGVRQIEPGARRELAKLFWGVSDGRLNTDERQFG